jgi:hypothetical protein
LIHGGISTKKNVEASSFWKLDLETRVWSTLPELPVQATLWNHAMSVIQDQLILISGNVFPLSNPEPVQQIWNFDFNLNVWSNLTERMIHQDSEEIEVYKGGGTLVPIGTDTLMV